MNAPTAEMFVATGMRESAAVRGKRRTTNLVPAAREDGPCGNTVVTDCEVETARRLFMQELPTATSGLSIVQRMATLASADVSSATGAAGPNRRDVDSRFFTPNRATSIPLLRSVRNEHGRDGAVSDNRSGSGEDEDYDYDDGSDEDDDHFYYYDEDPTTGGDNRPADRRLGREQGGNGMPTGFHTTNTASTTTMSQRVVNSHLDYFRKFQPFREGRFTKDTLYQFLFYAVVENRLRMSYAKRVLRNLLSYVRRYLEEKGDGSDRVVVVIEKSDGRRVRTDIVLTQESVQFFRDNPRGTVVQARLFYRLMNSVGDRTNNQRLKNMVCEARRPRDLVFSEHQNAILLAFAFKALRVLVDKYVRRSVPGDTRIAVATSPPYSVGGEDDARIEEALDTLVFPASAVHTTPKGSDVERTTFEFCVAFLLGFLTGARTKSTIARLTVGEIDRLIRGGTIEKLTKGSFARVFVPENVVYTEVESPYVANGDDGRTRRRAHSFAADRDVFDPRDCKSVARLLYEITLVRRDPLLYPVRRVCKHVGAGGRCGYGAYRQCRNRRSRSSSSPDRSDKREVCRPKTGRVSVGCPYRSAECERELNETRRSNGSGGGGDDEQTFFLSGGRQLDYTFNRIYAKLFRQRRPRGVLWHSQRRRYLGAVNERFGAVVASKSVGHTDVETTMSYINKSMHREDTNRRAGSAVYEEMMRLVDTRERTPFQNGTRNTSDTLGDVFGGPRDPRDGRTGLTLTFDL